jgi:hypothetical protein
MNKAAAPYSQHRIPALGEIRQQGRSTVMRTANDNIAVGKISDDGEITIDVLERCLDRLAIVMHRASQGGEVYLPIFERLEAEIEAKKASESTMARALRRVRR